MLKLLRCEFAKLKRKPLFFAAAAISALIPLGCALFLPEMQEFSSGAEAVDRLMSTLFQLSAYLLLMPAIVVLASNLLFEEQDNDTLKNLLTIPVSKPALALAKMTLLFWRTGVNETAGFPTSHSSLRWRPWTAKLWFT